MTITDSTEDNISEIEEEISEISDKNLDQTLRPQAFSEYIGQEKIKKNLVKML